VKPDGTALWRSRILPWSDTLTGNIGQDPGYDPLLAVTEDIGGQSRRDTVVSQTPRTGSVCAAGLAGTGGLAG
jgi:hypothetical protein